MLAQKLLIYYGESIIPLADCCIDSTKGESGMNLTQPALGSEGIAKRWEFMADLLGFQRRQEVIHYLFKNLPDILAGFGHFESQGPFGANIILQNGGGVLMFVTDKADSFTLFSFTPLMLHSGSSSSLRSQATMEDAGAVAQVAYELLSAVDM